MKPARPWATINPLTKPAAASPRPDFGSAIRSRAARAASRSVGAVRVRFLASREPTSYPLAALAVTKNPGSSIIARPVTLIAGATASGKSALALDLARSTGAVIVNADSQQLYAGLSILTARPTPGDEAATPHRLYGVADPREAWSVGRWLREAEPILAEETRPLIFVGGTGLYFHALTRGLAPTPPVEPGVREAVEAFFEAAGETAVRQALAQADPAVEARIMAGDRQRLVRALAVARSTGRPLSGWQAETRPVLAPGAYSALVVERPREVLYARCDARVDAMMAAGALEEARDLAALSLATDLPVMKAVGVRELIDLARGALDADTAVSAVKRSTRRYAKRQLTWFRNQTPDWPRTGSDITSL